MMAKTSSPFRTRILSCSVSRMLMIAGCVYGFAGWIATRIHFLCLGGCGLGLIHSTNCPGMDDRPVYGYQGIL